ncbi:MAG: DNA polymerase III subunit gamma/tau [Alistipes sp.]|nr:DNA polymerase III subunit gamma/tau [Alistipes sp.]
MSEFIVSARKYRPATFASVVGQKHITSTLKNAIERGQLAHAYLFCGPRGVGKTTCARIFAKAINCLSPSGAEACNECESCRSFNEGRSLNIHELDAASNNSVEDIRTLIEQVRIIPQVGRYSVFIIDEVHMLSAAAFNAFLKTLEEPPAHAVFILATTEKHKIIPTILSRCQIYDFNRIRVEDSVEYLRYIASQEGITADEESLNLIAQKADGGMRDALSMFDKAVSFCGPALDYRNVAQTLNVLDYDTYFGVTEMLLAGDYVRALVAFDEVLAKGFSGQTFMAGLNRHMRDLLMAKRPETLRLIEMTGTLLERYRTQAGACDVGFLFGAIACLTELDGRIRQSSNQRLLVELGLMKISGLGQKKNDSLTSPEDYPLPELSKAPQPAATPAAAPAAPAGANAVSAAAVSETAAKPSAAPVAAPAPDAVSAPADTDASVVARSEVPVAEPVAGVPVPALEPVSPAPQSAAASRPEPQVRQPAGAAQPVASTSGPASADVAPKPAASASPVASAAPAATPSTASRPARKSLISGASLADLIAGKDSSDAAAEGDPLPQVPADYDAECTAKLERARGQILEMIRSRRPRFVPAFEEMKIQKNIISVSVPTMELHDEIMRNKTAMLIRIAELAGVMGVIDLRVTVNEAICASRPIKPEDKLKFLTEKNPLVTELRKVLDLEME